MLSTLIELQRLKNLDRTGWTLRGLPNGTESVAAHSFGVSVIAMLLADDIKRRGTDIQVEQVLRMALLHDWAESRVGDMPKTATDYFGSDVRKQAESKAFADLTAALASGGFQYQDAYHDYEQRKSIEARLVKAADILDLLVQALVLERAGARGLDEFWAVAESADFQLPAPANEVVNELLIKILESRAAMN